MRRIVGYFAQGCLALIPIAVTVYIIYAVITATDQLLGIDIPGLGLVIALTLITLVGFLVSNVIGRRVYWLFDQVMTRVPFVKLLYTSIRDLIQTFVGDKKTIGRPVAIRFSPGAGIDRLEEQHRMLGLLTRDDLTPMGLPHHVAVYIPQAYNIGGQVLAVHRDQIEHLNISSSEMLTFMMSGGASGLGAQPSSAQSR